MDTNEIKQVLMNKLALTDAIVTGDGSHFQVIAVGDLFDGMSRVKQQQAVYAPLMEYIADNRIHALSIKAYTPAQWERDRKLSGL
ncbi:BolA family iron metabolism protein IbaG [Morganella morganii]|uniref:BolA family iron metabolism protein IbaG n=1 Tax=Morganella morganii TaxID=582 RepID=UPI0012996FC1|nr:BolA family iron metabolism protein IbaG [Morganella morganii]HDU8646966.1 BolA family iron metabolism protein IbaG [Morganella morganii subsp. morganii]MCU6354360.1 BolA family iron metabolism protein IbaG [Morganella morganii]MRE57278.1 BolA/IbaG family iron-sulfur metabolism protein [Morganella morganii]HBL6964640.1 BolA family iron metabolism protein IbaG [Morganella morganii]HCR3334156.1 BolA family iron metabolism protein IbaG [Morganella morganii]